MSREAINSHGLSQPAQVSKASIRLALGEEHRDVLRRAVLNILSTNIAEITFAQIIDGLPLADVALDSSSSVLPDEHPIYDAHPELCSGVLQKTREFRDQFDPDSLSLDVTLINEYRAASPGSRAFKARLVEITALAIHEIAVQLFNMDTSHHKDDDIASWIPPPEDQFWEFYPPGPWPTLFRHGWYVDHDQYPNGVGDMVGFWAEARIFGGVVLFDRRDPSTCDDAQPDSIWLHPDRYDITYRIYQLSDEQRQRLLDFLTAEDPDLGLLPILGDEKNMRREDPEEPIEETGIYRSLWERRPLSPDAVDGRLKDVWDQFNYPLRTDYRRAQRRAYDRKARR